MLKHGVIGQKTIWTLVQTIAIEDVNLIPISQVNPLPQGLAFLSQHILQHLHRSNLTKILDVCSIKSKQSLQ